MDSTLFNYYFLAFAGTILVGLFMVVFSLLAFVAVMSVVGILYGVVPALRRLMDWALGFRPMVSPTPIVLRRSSRPVFLARQRTTMPVNSGTRQAPGDKTA